jgi:ATP-dependent RNA helicase RhlE
MTFNELGLIEPILKALATEGYVTPTPIQQQAIPVVLQQRDLLGCAQTGTGKTAAFALPIIQLHHQAPPAKGPMNIKTLILTPTRELAIQIGDSFKAYGAFTRIRHTVIFGGVGQQPQTDALKRGVEVLIATPGRLLDLMQQGYVHLNNLEIFVLDEADRMLDMGFIHDVRKVIAKLPSQRQTLFFSATMPNEIQKLADTILRNPEKVAVTPVSSTAEKVQQSVFFADKNEKKNLLIHLLQDPEIKAALVFSRTKHGANKIAKELLKVRITAEAIHGNKSQTARQTALSNFKNGKTRVLVATDIAARGIDIDDLAYVFNYDLPNVPETYVHRIGRTGRAGASGQAISFCDQEERAYLRDIEKLIGKKVPVGVISPDLAIQISAPSPDSEEETRENLPRGGGRNQRQQSAPRQPQQPRNATPPQRQPAPQRPQNATPQRQPKPQNNPQPVWEPQANQVTQTAAAPPTQRQPQAQRPQPQRTNNRPAQEPRQEQRTNNRPAQEPRQEQRNNATAPRQQQGGNGQQRPQQRNQPGNMQQNHRSGQPLHKHPQQGQPKNRPQTNSNSKKLDWGDLDEFDF